MSQQRWQEFICDGAFGRECENQTGETFCKHGVDRLKPQPLAHGDERLAAERKEGLDQVDNGMVVQKRETDRVGERRADRQLPYARAPKEQDDLRYCGWSRVRSHRTMTIRPE